MGKRLELLIDMDGVMCDHTGGMRKKSREFPDVEWPQSIPGFWEELNPLVGAVETYKELEEYYDVAILTKPSEYNLISYSEKAAWVRKHLGFEAQKKMFMGGDKARVTGHLLVDDQLNANQINFHGKLLRFGLDEFPNWAVLRKYLMDLHYKVHKLGSGSPLDLDERFLLAIS